MISIPQLAPTKLARLAHAFWQDHPIWCKPWFLFESKVKPGPSSLHHQPEWSDGIAWESSSWHSNASANSLKRTALRKIESEFPYALRVSSRARSLRIQVRPYVGVEVVVPKRFPRRQIAGILQQHRDWITRQLQKHAHTFEETALPVELNLGIDGSRREIDYRKADKHRLREHPQGISIEMHNDQAAIDLLRGWVRSEAKRQLIPRVEALARHFGFTYQRVRVGSQKSRWGSCSSNGTISLNDQLLFMPTETVDYLIIHELCHTRHMNHSPVFWRLVGTCCPDYRRHEDLLNLGKQRIPGWFLRDLYC